MNPEAPSSPITPARPKRPAPGEAGRVLVVDDVMCLCEGLRRSLRQSGYEVAWVQDGGQAIIALGRGPFDAVLTDLNMPHVTGDELIARLNEVRPGLPCIVMTGHATRERVLRLLQNPNVVGILVKPLDHARLLVLLAEAVKKSRAAGRPHPAPPSPDSPSAPPDPPSTASEGPPSTPSEKPPPAGDPTPVPAGA